MMQMATTFTDAGWDGLLTGIKAGARLAVERIVVPAYSGSSIFQKNGTGETSTPFRPLRQTTGWNHWP